MTLNQPDATINNLIKLGKSSPFNLFFILSSITAQTSTAPAPTIEAVVSNYIYQVLLDARTTCLNIC